MSIWKRLVEWQRDRAFWAREARLMATWWEREAERKLGLHMVIVGIFFWFPTVAAIFAIRTGELVLRDFTEYTILATIALVAVSVVGVILSFFGAIKVVTN